MASIQIHDIHPAETPMEDLSYDVAGEIQGGFTPNQLQFLRDFYAFFIQLLQVLPDEPRGAGPVI